MVAGDYAGGLNEQGVPIGRYKVRRLMRDHQLKPVWKRKFMHTTDSKHNLPVFDNVLTAVCANRRQPSLGCRYCLLYARAVTSSIWQRSWICFLGK